MSSGIRAMMRAAGAEPLNFYVSMYSGGLIISGRVGQSTSWYDATKWAQRQNAWVALKKKLKDDVAGIALALLAVLLGRFTIYLNGRPQLLAGTERAESADPA